ncbi:MAG: CarD family transcriptional regulator [Thermodesulfobacteriota bacterium]|nr:CarD family transcriptional regulator [Thermodesulfobacteriota bacterium]
MFKTGDMAVYPTHGVGIIESIEHKEISGDKQTFYVLRVLGNGMTIMIPTDNADSVGLRQVISQKQVPKVYKILKKKNIEIDAQTWNRRYREYIEKIKTGSIFEVAGVLRDLFLLRVDKDLSFGERRMLDTARNLLIKELSIVKKSPEKSIEKELKKIFEY